MPEGVNSTGGAVAQGTNLTATVVQSVLVAPLQAASIFLSSGVPITDSANPVKFPKAPSPNLQVAYVPENTQIPEISPTFDNLTLLPDTMQPLGGIEKFSRQLARQSVPVIDQALQTHLVSSISGTLDTQLVAGAGDGVTTIKGLLNQTGNQTLPVGGALSIDNVLDAISLLELVNVPVETLQLWLHPAVKNKLAKLKDSTGQYLLQPDVTQAGRSTLAGVPVVSTQRLPLTPGASNNPATSTAVLWSPSLAGRVVRDVNVSVEFLTERYADFDQIGVKALTRYDFGLVRPAAVVQLTGVTSS